MTETINKIIKSIETRVDTLCKTNLNAKNLIRTMNEFAISQINYYVGIVEMEADQFKEIDENIRRILTRHHVHQQPVCKERFHLTRNVLGRTCKCENRSERMLLQLHKALEFNKEILLTSRSILKTE
ncbi:hypothetical protein NGRA_2815 [Nosema granulosis]|uniref:Uncharacterized protein n=1 Tax=Nosema granulosis TaxID=83296 RepID=A0A9P6KXU3_9MICR|nr:hypothetical protein NGRA_2815 [Nosema granulosis]